MPGGATGAPSITCAAFPVKAVDTLGAGDVFHGAFALALAEGREFDRRHALLGRRRRDQMHPVRRRSPARPGAAGGRGLSCRRRMPEQ